jgi:hypothetical protein
MFKRHHHVYSQADAGAGTGGGDGSAAAGETTTGGDATAAPGGAATGGATGGAADTSSGSQATQATGEPNLLAAAAALNGGADLSTKFPEQLRVMKADGTLDVEASASKLADSYTALTARMRETGAPPKEASEYTVTVPEALDGKWSPDTDEGVTAFREKALEMGLTQKQFDGVMSAYLERIPGLVEQTVTKAHDNAVAELQKHWPSTAQMQQGQRNAFRAVNSLMGDETDAVIEQLGNNPLFLRMAAKFGEQMGEDGNVPSGGAAGSAYAGKSRAQLMAEPAYTDPKHVDHALVSGMVRNAYAREFGTADAT